MQEFLFKQLFSLHNFKICINFYHILTAKFYLYYRLKRGVAGNPATLEEISYEMTNTRW